MKYIIKLTLCVFFTICCFNVIQATTTNATTQQPNTIMSAIGIVQQTDATVNAATQQTNAATSTNAITQQPNAIMSAIGIAQQTNVPAVINSVVQQTTAPTAINPVVQQTNAPAAINPPSQKPNPQGFNCTELNQDKCTKSLKCFWSNNSVSSSTSAPSGTTTTGTTTGSITTSSTPFGTTTGSVSSGTTNVSTSIGKCRPVVHCATLVQSSCITHPYICSFSNGVCTVNANNNICNGLNKMDCNKFSNSYENQNNGQCYWLGPDASGSCVTGPGPFAPMGQ